VSRDAVPSGLTARNFKSLGW